ncbi:hypothetical protein [Maribacter forsetii]|uniref:hypothetical protein n=1 Tax=Maribacter forsetii TaxID=444515 RepID=UPI00068941CC|nr:hypothetical protein [Maribacter forsetii]
MINHKGHLENLNIELYPDFNEVFESDQLKGIFYPLCKITNIETSPDQPLYFVSSNGIWTNENIKNENNQTGFTCFELKNGKYSFNGNLNVYIGHKEAKEIIKILEDDFQKNGAAYLSKKVKTQIYIKTIKENFDLNFGDLDKEYFLETFYQFSVNKLNYKQTGNFGTFRHIIDGWGKPDEISPVVYEIKDDNSTGFTDIEINQEFLFPKSITIDKYEKIGYTIGHEFFTDGNDTYLLFDKTNKRALCINHYS